MVKHCYHRPPQVTPGSGRKSPQWRTITSTKSPGSRRGLNEARCRAGQTRSSQILPYNMVTAVFPLSFSGFFTDTITA